MDLGFGSLNQEIGQATANALLRGAQQQEQTVEAELAQYDKLLDDEDALEDLRQRRLQQLQQQYEIQQKYKQLGHGTYQELSEGSVQGNASDIAKAFFEASKESDRLVVHFYRPSTRYCDTFHAHLETLAPKHMESRFLRINVEGCDDSKAGNSASYLVEKLGIVIMPTLVLIKNRKAFHHIRGFDELGGGDDFSSDMLAHVLGCHGIIDLRDDEGISEEILKSRGVNSVKVKKGGIKKGYYEEGDDEFE